MSTILKGLAALLLFLSVAAAAGLPEPGTPGAPADARYCGEPERDVHGRIKRDDDAKRRFARAFPKPHDGREWHIDHVVPLACGGCDLPFNMQWLPTEMKSAAGELPKDRWERRVYCQEAPK